MITIPCHKEEPISPPFAIQRRYIDQSVLLLQYSADIDSSDIRKYVCELRSHSTLSL